MIIIYGSSLSPFVRKVLAYAQEKDIAAESKPIAPLDESPEFREISPFGKIPAMRDGDFALADSSAIITYLEAKHPSPAMLPSDPQARGQVIWWEEFADTILSGCVGKIFFNRIVAPLFMNMPGDSKVADACARDELPRFLGYLEQNLEGRDFLVGDSLTLADLAVVSPLANFGHADISLADYPATQSWCSRMLARPSYAERLAWEQSLIAKMRSKIAGA